MSKLPHIGVCARLRPSSIHGIGCFAIIDIPAGTELFPNSSGEMTWVRKNELYNLPTEIVKMYEDFGVERGGLMGCPLSFNCLDTSWYLNHSDTPNARCNIEQDYDFYAMRDIKKGEEITVNYNEYAYL